MTQLYKLRAGSASVVIVRTQTHLKGWWFYCRHNPRWLIQKARTRGWKLIDK